MPRTSVFICRAIRYEIFTDRHRRQRITCDHNVKPLNASVSVETKPLQAFVGFIARGHLDWHMGVDNVLARIQAGVRVNHFRHTVILGVKDVQIAVDGWFKRNANPIAVMKFPRRISADGFAELIPHKESVTETDRADRLRTTIGEGLICIRVTYVRGGYRYRRAGAGGCGV